MPRRKYLTRNECAESLGVSTDTIRRWEMKGVLPKALRQGTVGDDHKFRGVVRYPKDEFDAAVARLHRKRW